MHGMKTSHTQRLLTSATTTTSQIIIILRKITDTIDIATQYMYIIQIP